MHINMGIIKLMRLILQSSPVANARLQSANINPIEL